MGDKQNLADEERRWASVRSRVTEGSTFDRAYVVMNVLATVVACYGLLGNSAAVVIGAMIIAMLLGPIAGVGLALVDGDNRLLIKASAALAGGVVVVLITAFLIGLAHGDVPATTEMMTRTSPNLFDLMIGLGGGAAGAYAIISKRLSVAFVGVAIATALVPPLAVCSLFLARGQTPLAAGAFAVAFTNIVAIQFACSVVFFLARVRAIVKREVLLVSLSLSLVLILGALLAVSFHHAVVKQLYESNVRATLQSQLLGYPGAFLADLRFSQTKDSNIVRAVVRAPQTFSAEQVAHMESRLPTSPQHARTTLVLRCVHTTVMSSHGPLYSEQNAGADSDGP